MDSALIISLISNFDEFGAHQSSKYSCCVVCTVGSISMLNFGCSIECDSFYDMSIRGANNELFRFCSDRIVYIWGVSNCTVTSVRRPAQQSVLHLRLLNWRGSLRVSWLRISPRMSPLLYSEWPQDLRASSACFWKLKLLDVILSAMLRRKLKSNGPKNQFQSPKISCVENRLPSARSPQRRRRLNRFLRIND